MVEMKDNRYPQVLFLGNGINRAYDGGSWKNLLSQICVRDDIDINRLTSPMPLQAILVTDNDIQNALKKHHKDLYGRIGSDAQKEVLLQILTSGFDHIITTNYSYELEMAGIGKSEITDYTLKHLMRSSIPSEKADTKYCIRTYNEVMFERKKNKIWHIHGEARKPSSIILGHYYYGNLFFKIREYIRNRHNTYKKLQENQENIKINSWIDAFILGDVYILGFGYDLSEFDLWWLLERKESEKADTGKIHFFTPEPYDVDEKLLLLKTHRCVEIEHCGIQLPPKPAETATSDEKEQYTKQCNDLYHKFYPLALERINKVKEGITAWQSL